MKTTSELLINDRKYRVEVEAGRNLLSVLRDELDLTGTKYGCGEGQCGACTVLVDGVPVRSCMTSIETAAGKKITTIEGLEKDGRLHPLQESFLRHDAMQCSFCTSGMIVSAAGLLKKFPNPTDNQVIQYMNGNICRCGTYPRILAAIREAAKTVKESPPSSSPAGRIVNVPKGGSR